MSESGKPGEFELISRFFAPLCSGEKGAFGLTDDAAVLSHEPGKNTVVTTDCLIAGVHFPVDAPAEQIAWRLIAVNLSDLAAMGATPEAYTLALAMGQNRDSDWMQSFADGLKQAQDEFSITLIGGDTVATPGPLTLTLTALGRVDAGRELRRNGAKAGDDIYVSGTIGDAALGLKILKGELGGLSPEHKDFLLDRYHRPQPRIGLGQRLGGIANAAIDISDGLAADLGHIAETSGLSAILEAGQIPLSGAAQEAISQDPLDLNLVIGGGDDYELLFSAPSSKGNAIRALSDELGLPLTPVGKMASDGNKGAVTVLNGQGEPIALTESGYRHF